MTYEPLRLAMHGYGYIGRMHVLASQLLQADVRDIPHLIWDTAVVRSLDSAAARHANSVFATVIDDIQQLHDGMDAIDIASPNDAHATAIDAACRRRLAIYCEKPVSNAIDVSRRLVSQVEAAGLVQQVALVYRFHPAVMEASALLKSGAMGKVLTFRAELLHGGYLDRSRPMSWRLQQHASGGGAVTDLGVHMFDLVHCLLGPVASLRAWTKTFVPQRQGQSGMESVQVDDWAHVQVDLACGATGSIEVSRVHYGSERSLLDLVCENGTMHLALDEDGGVSVTMLPGVETPRNSERFPALKPFSHKVAQSVLLNSHALCLAAFALRVRGVDVHYPVPTMRDALLAEEVAEAVIRSGRREGERIDRDGIYTS